MRGLIAELVSSRHQMTVVDMEAGLEHLSRSGGTLRHVDQLLIVTEMDRKALETARHTYSLARELGIERIGLIGNKLRDDADKEDLNEFCASVGVELVAALPEDDQVRQADRRGVALFDFAPNAATVHALEALATRLEHQFELLPERSRAHQELPVVFTAQTQQRFPECN